ncbi:hypothetical protein [Arthrobacter sp. H14-L1]|uniref:hypothetical protein n=1 Tax=Arthrobacter sp. H14-L1 TaxID=2996697 RepID=UPI00226E72A7|nr:hypothetical protein [Arthrobacter sp. H14-L1]MCY0904579.1 hypothetical protein [Arthrobacter sp. H14-L1]
MSIELRIIAHCPNSAPARELFRRALELEGLDGQSLTVREITTQEEAEELHFHGSPTFSIRGLDLFPSEADPAITCRMYACPSGLSGLPTLAALRQALNELIS